jgi:hypothetical protein
MLKLEAPNSPEEKAPMGKGKKLILFFVFFFIIMGAPTIFKKVASTTAFKKRTPVSISRDNSPSTTNSDAEATEESEPVTELRREAEKWIKNSCSFKEKRGEYFSFSCGAVNPCTDCGSGENEWTATSKVKIGDCPAGSVWIMVRWAHEGGTGGNNKVSPECKSITPKVITNFNFSEDYN